MKIKYAHESCSLEYQSSIHNREKLVVYSCFSKLMARLICKRILNILRVRRSLKIYLVKIFFHFNLFIYLFFSFRFVCRFPSKTFIRILPLSYKVIGETTPKKHIFHSHKSWTNKRKMSYEIIRKTLIGLESRDR